MTTDNLWIPNGSFRPRRYRPGGIGNWSGHLPFANDLIAEIRPNVLVELGTHYGESYFGFCQAVAENSVSCSCYAVDTWMGESHSGLYDESVYQEVNAYNNAHYRSFSYLLRSTFDDAAVNFSDGSIDILHIDGLHTYEAVAHDFRHWFEKVKPGGIVLMHDTMARHADFGVWKFWEELAGSESNNHFAFTHNWGLGVFRKPGSACPDNRLFAALFDSSPRYKDHIRKFYANAALALTCEHDCAARAGSGTDSDSIKAELDALRAERDAVSKERDLLKADRENWNSERESMSLAHRKLHSELYVTRTDLSTTRADLEAAQERLKILDECQAKCERLEHALQDVEISYSWRVTKPLRELMVFLRKGPRSR